MFVQANETDQQFMDYKYSFKNDVLKFVNSERAKDTFQFTFNNKNIEFVNPMYKASLKHETNGDVSFSMGFYDDESEEYELSSQMFMQFENDNLKKYTVMNKDEGLELNYEYETDTNNNTIVTVTGQKIAPNFVYTLASDYKKYKELQTFDSFGRLIKRVSYRSNGTNEQFDFYKEYEYDSNGNTTKETYGNIALDSPVDREINDYNSKNLIISHTVEDYVADNFILDSRKEYEYDDNNNLVKYTYFDENDLATRIVTKAPDSTSSATIYTEQILGYSDEENPQVNYDQIFKYNDVTGVTIETLNAYSFDTPNNRYYLGYASERKYYDYDESLKISEKQIAYSSTGDIQMNMINEYEMIDNIPSPSREYSYVISGSYIMETEKTYINIDKDHSKLNGTYSYLMIDSSTENVLQDTKTTWYYDSNWNLINSIEIKKDGKGRPISNKISVPKPGSNDTYVSLNESWVYTTNDEFECTSYTKLVYSSENVLDTTESKGTFTQVSDNHRIVTDYIYFSDLSHARAHTIDTAHYDTYDRVVEDFYSYEGKKLTQMVQTLKFDNVLKSTSTTYYDEDENEIRRVNKTYELIDDSIVLIEQGTTEYDYVKNTETETIEYFYDDDLDDPDYSVNYANPIIVDVNIYSMSDPDDYSYYRKYYDLATQSKVIKIVSDAIDERFSNTIKSRITAIYNEDETLDYELIECDNKNYKWEYIYSGDNLETIKCYIYNTYYTDSYIILEERNYLEIDSKQTLVITKKYDTIAISDGNQYKAVITGVYSYTYDSETGNIIEVLLKDVAVVRSYQQLEINMFIHT